MRQFKNLMLTLTGSANVNFLKVAYTRRAKLIEEGYNVNNVNWDHYARVLEAKHELNKA